MSDLKDLLHGAGEAKRQLFASEDFAGGYGHAVIGRVKRRRVVSATAMGGGSALAVGVLAVGASHVPWGAFVMGASPASSPSVVCTTSTPDAVAASGVTVPEGAGWALVDNPSGEIVFLGAINGVGAAWSSDGVALPLEDATDPEGIAVLTLPSGRAVPYITKDGTGWVLPRRETNVTVLTLDEYAGLPGSAVSVTAEDGTVLGRAIHTASDSLGMVADGKFYQLVDPDGSTYAYVDGNGQQARVSLVDNNPSGSTSHTSATPVVTCVTSSPEPSASPSADPSGSSAPTPNPTGNIVAGDTPFQCGYVFASDESGTDALRVYGAPTTDSAVHKVFEQWYGDQAPTTLVGESGATAYHASLGSAEVTGLSSSLDPASKQSIQASRDYGMPSLGFTFVAVKDGVAVATVVPQDDGATPGMLADRDDTAAPEEAFLWDLDALTPCGTTSIDGAQIYAVAGFGQDDNFAYAWKNVSE